MNKLIVFIIIIVVALGTIGTSTAIIDSYATIALKQSQQPSENTTARPERQTQQPSESPGATTVPPERQSQQPSEAPGAMTVRPERQSQFNSEQQEDDTTVRPERQSEFSPEQQEDNAIELKDEQIRDVQQEEDDNENTGGNEEEQIVIDKAPVIISGDNTYIVWFNDHNTPNNNSEVLFRSSADGGVTFADKINLSNTTTADSINAEIAADGNNVIITWWERNATSEEPVVRVSTDSGTTFGPILRLASNGTISG
jgi:hypothetical protein